MERSCIATELPAALGSTAAWSKVQGTAGDCSKLKYPRTFCHCKHWGYAQTIRRLRQSVGLRCRDRSWHHVRWPLKRSKVKNSELAILIRAGKGERIDIYEGAPRPEPQPKPSILPDTSPDGSDSESPRRRRRFVNRPVPPVERRRRKRKQQRGHFNVFFLAVKACVIASLAHTVAMNLAYESSTWEVSVVVALAVFFITKLTREVPPLKEAGIRLFRQREEQAASGLLTLVAGGVCTVLWGALSNGYNIGLATLLLQFAAVGYMFGTYGRLVRAGL